MNQMEIASCVLHLTVSKRNGNVPVASVLRKTKFVMELQRAKMDQMRDLTVRTGHACRGIESV